MLYRFNATHMSNLTQIMFVYIMYIYQNPKIPAFFSFVMQERVERVLIGSY